MVHDDGHKDPLKSCPKFRVQVAPCRKRKNPDRTDLLDHRVLGIVKRGPSRRKRIKRCGGGCIVKGGVGGRMGIVEKEGCDMHLVYFDLIVISK